ncbi:MAG: 3-deoxy-manno-octulosonate cytidylyltransferase [Patescibacteria group bacterium]
MKIVGFIPARMGSSRFPGKPLADILGKAMIEHVYYRSKLSDKLDDLYIATPDKEIEDYCLSRDIKVVMTSPVHERATDRTAEATQKIENKTNEKIDIVILIQGDEPLLYPEMINLALKPLINDSNILTSNLMSPLKSIEEQEDPNEVKVVVDKDNFALYFSREPIPSRKKGAKNFVTMKQVCIMPWRRDFLFKYTSLKQTPLEIIESVDTLRCIENGFKVKMVPCDFNTYSVDTINDLNKVREMMKKDSLFLKYSNIR